MSSQSDLIAHHTHDQCSEFIALIARHKGSEHVSVSRKCHDVLNAQGARASVSLLCSRPLRFARGAAKGRGRTNLTVSSIAQTSSPLRDS